MRAVISASRLKQTVMITIANWKTILILKHQHIRYDSWDLFGFGKRISTRHGAVINNCKLFIVKVPTSQATESKEFKLCCARFYFTSNNVAIVLNHWNREYNTLNSYLPFLQWCHNYTCCSHTFQTKFEIYLKYISKSEIQNKIK